MSLEADPSIDDELARDLARVQREDDEAEMVAAADADECPWCGNAGACEHRGVA